LTTSKVEAGVDFRCVEEPRFQAAKKDRSKDIADSPRREKAAPKGLSIDRLVKEIILSGM
jgi:hypothetical protein